MVQAGFEEADDAPWNLNGELVMAFCSASDYKSIVTKLAKRATEGGGSGVILTANRPHATLLRSFQEAGIETENIQFLDCITPVANIGRPNATGVVYVDSPTLLETMVLRFEQLQRRLKDGNRFLIIDSLSSLAVYNGEDAVTEMLHNLSSRLRIREISGAFIAVESQSTPEFVDEIANHCDRSLHFKDGSL